VKFDIEDFNENLYFPNMVEIWQRLWALHVITGVHLFVAGSIMSP
jgi:hypothetical protein